jgi:hypothetical protein
MPELLFPITLAFKLNSKSPMLPPSQIKKVLPEVFFWLVVSPTMTPFSTFQKSGLPLQPERSLPLNRSLASSAQTWIMPRRENRVRIFLVKN